MTLLPWEYLFKPFNSVNFPDLFYETVGVSLVGLVALVVLYNVRTRQLRHHPPYLDLYEWLLWTGIIVFLLLPMYAIFVFDFIFVLVTILVGAAIFLWIRFYRFPPIFAQYETRLAKQRYFARNRLARPEATIRPKKARRRH